MVIILETIDIIIIILFSLLLCAFIGFIIFKSFCYKISRVQFKIDDANNSINDKLIIKYNLIKEMIDFCNKKLNIESKTFNSVKKIKDNSIKMNDDKLLNNVYSEIVNIIDDNNKKEIGELNNLIKKYEENELHIISLRTYYNKNVIMYNSLFRNFPFSVIQKVKGYKIYLLFEGEELSFDDDFIEV